MKRALPPPVRCFAVVLLFATTLAAATFPTGRPSTTNNDDSCDIAVLPAATLMLPFFEVDINAPISTAKTTLFTVVNTTRVPQIAKVTIWTDLSYPILSFPVFLTGYDAQAFNLYDIIGRGVIGQVSSARPPGSRSAPNSGNTNFLPAATQTCANPAQEIPPFILFDLQQALTTGNYAPPPCEPSTRVGLPHDTARGYLTIDVVANCSFTPPSRTEYFDELLFDNVLTGDYELISPNPATGNYAGGSSLVHIRAIPEGGAAGAQTETNLPYTFYDRFTPVAARKMDRRQPLPATFASRFIQGGPTAFQTDLQIWREGRTRGVNPTCNSYPQNSMPVTNIVRFDERENPTTTAPSPSLPSPLPILFPATSRVSSAHSNFPPLNPSGDVGGWMFLNLNNGGSTNYSSTVDLSAGSTTAGPRPSQNWVSVSMFAEGRYSVMFDATMMSNGCSPAPAPVTPIGPGPDDTP